MAREGVRGAAMLLAPVPALLVGALVMRGAGVPAVLRLLDLAAAAVGAAVAVAALARRRPEAPRGRSVPWVLGAGLALLAATLLAPGVEGVHRWLPLGPVRIHAAALLLPALLVVLARAPWVASATAALAVLAVLALQPDAAQAASFAAAWIWVARVRGERRAAAVVAASVLLAGACLLRPDPLEPVPHVEGIVGMAAAQGAVLAGAALLSLGLLPLAFALCAGRPVGTALALYTAGTLVAAWLGDFPVPFLGYGVSPILGYYGAVAAWAVLRRAPPTPDGA